MKKRKHLHTQFIKYIIEKYGDNPDGDIDIPLDDDENQLKKRKSLYPIEIEEDEEEDDDILYDENDDDDDIIIEKLLREYKKVKAQYENRKIHYRKK